MKIRIRNIEIELRWPFKLINTDEFEDMRKSLRERYGREPTDREITDFIDKLETVKKK